LRRANSTSFKRRSHCIKGHEYTLENTAYWTGRKGRKFRICKTCKKTYHAMRRPPPKPPKTPIAVERAISKIENKRGKDRRSVMNELVALGCRPVDVAKFFKISDARLVSTIRPHEVGDRRVQNSSNSLVSKKAMTLTTFASFIRKYQV
jgi:hypothetical protein